jgi:hypothetical protein
MAIRMSQPVDVKSHIKGRNAAKPGETPRDDDDATLQITRTKDHSLKPCPERNRSPVNTVYQAV